MLNIRKVNLHPKKKSSQPRFKGARIGISPRSSIPTPSSVPKTPTPSSVPKTFDPSSPMYHVPKFMIPYNERYVDVVGDGHCGFRAIAESVGLTEESHVMVRRALIQELKDHKEDYMKVYADGLHGNHYKYILDGLHPPKNVTSFAPPHKWLTLLDMGHIVATYYNRPVVEITSLDIGVSETFFPLRGRPPTHPKSNSGVSTRARRRKHGRINFWSNTVVSEHSWILREKRDRLHQKNQQIKTILLCCKTLRLKQMKNLMILWSI
jgi:hypothetical protein